MVGLVICGTERHLLAQSLTGCLHFLSMRMHFGLMTVNVSLEGLEPY